MSKLIVGSLGAVAKKNNHSIAAGFMNVRAFVMVDVSGSMSTRDCGDGRQRFEVAQEQLEKLQNENPSEIAVGCFSNDAQFCPSGVPVFQMGMTDMVKALNLMRMADACGIRLVLISDGEPNDTTAALELASKFVSKIDTIYVGSETGAGREFLRDLSARTGGVSITTETNKLNLLSENITRLIAA